MLNLQQVEQDLTAAMKAKDAIVVGVLRGLKTRIQNERIAKMKDLSEEDLAQIFSDSSVKKVNKPDKLNIADFLVLAGVVESKRQAREDVRNNAIELNGEKVNDVNYLVDKKELLFGKYAVVKRGKNTQDFQ